MDNQAIGKYLLKKRQEKGLTQRQLAEQLGVTYQAVSRWEQGLSIPDIDTLVLIADYYVVAVDDILQREGYMNQPSTTLNFEEAKLPLLFFVITSIGFGIGAGLFVVLDEFNYRTIGILVHAIFVAGGLLINNMYLMMVDREQKRFTIWYFLSYLTAIISILITFLILSGIID